MPATARPSPSVLLHAAPVAWRLGEVGSRPSDAGFGALAAAYTASGGLAHGDALARLLDEHNTGDYISLARLIVGGDVFGLCWRGEFWVPMFQFDPVDLSLRESVRGVLAELGGIFDGWALATWFVHPNSWLHGRRPVELLDTHLEAVLEAARGDRYVANG